MLIVGLIKQLSHQYPFEHLPLISFVFTPMLTAFLPIALRKKGILKIF
jgi:hypothetical protein